MSTLTKLLSPSEATALTATINSTAGDLGELLLAAHDGKAWEALGYDSWRSYAVAEFKFSQSRAYRLMDHAKVIESISTIVETPGLISSDLRLEQPTVIETVSPIGEKSELISNDLPSEAVTRPLARLSSEKQREVWKEAVATAPNGRAPTARHVKTIIKNMSSNIDKTRIHPIPPAPIATARAVEARKDSETLWLLKTYWKKATKHERTLFVAWAEETQPPTNNRRRSTNEH